MLRVYKNKFIKWRFRNVSGPDRMTDKAMSLGSSFDCNPHCVAFE